jgi:hypothetical protein
VEALAGAGEALEVAVVEGVLLEDEKPEVREETLGWRGGGAV